MNALTKSLQEAKSTTFGIEAIMAAQSTQFSNNRAVVRVSKSVKPVFKRVIIEEIAQGWWAARFQKGDGSAVEKNTFRAEDIEGVMTQAILGYNNTAISIQ